MIPKWGKHYGKGKKSRQDMETKCGVFIEWLRRKHPERQDHNDMADTMPMKRPKRNLAANVSGAP